MDFRVSFLYKEKKGIVPHQMWVDVTGRPIGEGGELVYDSPVNVPAIGDCVAFTISVEAGGRKQITSVEGVVESRKFSYITTDTCDVSVVIKAMEI